MHIPPPGVLRNPGPSFLGPVEIVIYRRSRENPTGTPLLYPNPIFAGLKKTSYPWIDLSDTKTPDDFRLGCGVISRTLVIPGLSLAIVKAKRGC
jgi:hypothetical protein